MPTPKQKLQQSLSWALFICMGFRASAQQFIPEDVYGKQLLLEDLDMTISELQFHLKELKSGTT